LIIITAQGIIALRRHENCMKTPEKKKTGITAELDRLGLRGPCRFSEEDWILMQVASAVAIAGKEIVKTEEKNLERNV
jgi:hypothetical protein